MERQLAKVGDVVKFGLTIGTSEVGKGSFFIDPFSMVLKCLNGMQHNEYGSRKIHLGKNHGSAEAREWYTDATLQLDDQAFLAKTKDTVEHFFSGPVFDEIIAKMESASDTPLLAAPKEVIELVTKKYSFNEEESDLVLEHFIKEDSRSVWGLGNAVTRASQDLSSYNRASEFEAIGGGIIELPRNEWKTVEARA